MTVLSYLWMHKEDPEVKKVIFNNSSNPVLIKLKQIIKDQLISKNRDRLVTPEYNEASWAYGQADLNGSIRTLENILSLLNFVEDRK